MRYVLTEHYTDQHGDKRFHSVEKFDTKPTNRQLDELFRSRIGPLHHDSIENLLEGAGVATPSGSTYRLEKQP